VVQRERTAGYGVHGEGTDSESSNKESGYWEHGVKVTFVFFQICGCLGGGIGSRFKNQDYLALLFLRLRRGRGCLGARE
jgi:hypothetical protein